MISMDDVARRAGVSKATVSRVLSGKNPVSAATRKKVLTACKTLDYRVNANIQDLILKSRNGFTRNLAFIMAGTSFSDAAYSPFVDILAEEAGRRHYQLSLVKLTGSEKTIYDLPPLLRDVRADGLLLSGVVSAEILKPLRAMRVPIVVIGNYDPEILAGLSCIFFDQETPFRQLIADMHRAGCRKFAFATEPPQNFYITKNLEMIRNILHEYSLTLDPGHLYVGSHRFGGIRDKLEPVFRSQAALPFDGIIAPDFRLAQEISHLICARFGFCGEYPVKLGTIRREKTLPLPVTVFHAQIDSRKPCQAAMEQLIGEMDNSASPAFLTV